MPEAGHVDPRERLWQWLAEVQAAGEQTARRALARGQLLFRQWAHPEGGAHALIPAPVALLERELFGGQRLPRRIARVRQRHRHQRHRDPGDPGGLVHQRRGGLERGGHQQIGALARGAQVTRLPRQIEGAVLRLPGPVGGATCECALGVAPVIHEVRLGTHQGLAARRTARQVVKARVAYPVGHGRIDREPYGVTARAELASQRDHRQEVAQGAGAAEEEAGHGGMLREVVTRRAEGSACSAPAPTTSGRGAGG